MKLKVKSGSTVQVVAGADKGKKGKVLEVDRSKMKVRVEGVKVMTHFDRKDGIKKIEGFIGYSNVKVLDAAPATKAKKAAKTKAAAKSAT